MFITFEGVDFSGKTTQAGLAAARLRDSGREVMFLREPGGTDVSEEIRSILLKSSGRIDPSAELLLFAASRAQLTREVIIPALERNTVVVCDRFYDSTTAYQGYGRGLDLDDVAAVNRFAAGDAVPDLTIIVDVDPGTARARRQTTGSRQGRPDRPDKPDRPDRPDRIERSGDEFYRRVREGYAAIAAAGNGRLVTVDGTRPVQDVHEAIWEIIKERMKS